MKRLVVVVQVNLLMDIMDHILYVVYVLWTDVYSVPTFHFDFISLLFKQEVSCDMRSLLQTRGLYYEVQHTHDSDYIRLHRTTSSSSTSHVSKSGLVFVHHLFLQVLWWLHRRCSASGELEMSDSVQVRVSASSLQHKTADCRFKTAQQDQTGGTLPVI